MSNKQSVIYSLRFRISLALLVILLILISSVVLASNSNEQAEDKIYREFVASRAALLDESLKRSSDLLQTFAYDYTYWDEMVDFVQNPSDEKVDNLFNGSLNTYDADMLWIYNAQGELIYSASGSEIVKNPRDTPPFNPQNPLPSLLGPASPLINYYQRADVGMMQIYGASIHPSYDEARTTPAQGYFFTGRLLDESSLGQSAETLGGELQLIYDPQLIGQQETEFDHHSGRYGFITELAGSDGQTIGAIYASGYSESMHQVLTFRDRLIWSVTIVFVLVILAGYIISYIWVLKPLFMIQAALGSKDDQHIAKLKKNHDEFSMVATLMSDSMNLLNNYEAIMSSIKDGLLIANPEGYVERINQTALDILGYDADEIIGKQFVQVVPAYDYAGKLIPKSERPISVALTAKQSVESSHVFVGKNDRRVDVRLKVSPILRGDMLTGAIIIFNDNTQEVTSRRAIEKEIADKTAELRQVRARLEASINSLHLGFIMTDQQDQIVIINNSAKKLLAPAMNDSTKVWSFADVTKTLAAATNLKKATEKCLTDWDPVDIAEVELDDQILRLFVSPVLVHDESGNKINAIGCVILIEDITEGVVVSRSRDEFFSIASHELRTPLTSIKGNSAILLEYYGDALKDPAAHEMVDDIHESSQRLITIVNDFLDVSKIEQGKLKYELEPLEIQLVIAQVSKDLRRQAAAKKLRLIVGDNTHIPTVIGDKDRVKQVIYNLVGNAIKYTEKGEVAVRCELQHNMVKISVADTGAGIPEDRQKLLFRKFQQAGNSIWTRETSKGTGLGLYISKLLVEGMGGTIWLEKTPAGKGSVFSFTLLIDNEINNSLLLKRKEINDSTRVNTETGLVS